MAKNNELTVQTAFTLSTIYDGMDTEMQAELMDELADMDDTGGISCRAIKIPSGGGLAYEVEGDEAGDVDYQKDIEGVVVFTHRMNAFWPGEYGAPSVDGGRLPACSSMDGKTGTLVATGEVRDCERCPYNQYGSDGRGRGKACKNMRRVYLMQSGDPSLYLLTVPPTSIRDVNRQLARIMASRGIPYTGMVVGFRLEKTANADGTAYSKVVLERRGVLPPETAAVGRELRRQIKQQYQEVSVTAGDYAPPPPPDSDASLTVDASDFVDVDGDGELPFN